MRMTISTDGFMKLILDKAVSLGIAKTKNEALRLGMLSLNKEYNLINNKEIEMELVKRKIQQEQKKMKEKGERYLSAEEALKPYKHLLDK